MINTAKSKIEALEYDLFKSLSSEIKEHIENSLFFITTPSSKVILSIETVVLNFIC